MQIKRKIRKVNSAGSNIFLKNLFKIFIGLSITIVIFASGITLNRIPLHRNPLKRLVKEIIYPIFMVKNLNYRVVTNYFKGLRTSPEHIDIDVSFKNFQNLAYQRLSALDRARVKLSDFTEVPAEITHNGKKIKAQIRLKGDVLGVHLEGDNWSFRIKIKGEESLFGMRAFSIHRPEARNYVKEWIFFKALQREGIIVPRYEFIDVSLNGKHLGIYALEEHFDKELIESNRHREGVIVKFDEDLMGKVYWKYYGDKLAPAKTFQNSHIDAFKMGKIFKNESLHSQFEKAITLLSKFRNRGLKTSDVFDIETMAKHAALSEVFGGHHGMSWNNRRFYYNPITAKLEPIGFDTIEFPRIEFLYYNKPPWAYAEVFTSEDFNGILFSDLVFVEKYIHYLTEYSKSSYLDSLFKDIGNELERNVQIIYRKEPIYVYSPDSFYDNQTYIQKELDPDKALHAYFNGVYDGSIRFEVGNVHSLPVKVVSLSYKEGVVFPAYKEAIIRDSKVFSPVQYHTIEFIIPEDFSWKDDLVQDLKINSIILGTEIARHDSVFRWQRENIDMINDVIRREPNYENFDFLEVNNEERTITIKPGRWIVDDDMIISSGFKFISGPGVYLDLKYSSSIVSYSPCYFIGSEEHPIVVGSKDSTGQGIVVLKAGEKSRLEHVIFTNLSAPKDKGWELTGAVTFYESPVSIYDCRFIGNRDSDDALNIVRTEFSIQDSIFKDTCADAFDSDFSKGDIADTEFINCTNDGIDVSGTVVSIEDIFIYGAHDKGISVGENSRMKANRVKIRKARTAVASKDFSTIDFDNSAIYDSKIGFTAYRKKPEYGFGQINVNNLDKKDVDELYLIEEMSSITIDGTRIEGDQKKLFDQLYK